MSETGVRDELLRLHRETGEARFLEAAALLREPSLRELILDLVKPKTSRRGRRRVYTANDDRLLEMHLLIREGKARNATEAAGIVAASQLHVHSRTSTQTALRKLYLKQLPLKRAYFDAMVDGMLLEKRMAHLRLFATGDSAANLRRRIEGPSRELAQQRLGLGPTPWSKFDPN